MKCMLACMCVYALHVLCANSAHPHICNLCVLLMSISSLQSPCYTHTHTHTHIHTPHAHAHAHAHTHTHAYTHTNTCTCTHTHTYALAQTHPWQCRPHKLQMQAPLLPRNPPKLQLPVLQV